MITSFLENIRQGFQRTVSQNKYRSEITTQPKSNNLDYMIDLTLRNIYIYIVLENDNNDRKRNYFNKYCMP